MSTFAGRKWRNKKIFKTQINSKRQTMQLERSFCALGLHVFFILSLFFHELFRPGRPSQILSHYIITHMARQVKHFFNL